MIDHLPSDQTTQPAHKTQARALTGAVKRSVTRKFMLAMLLTTCTALLVSGATMLAYEVNTFRSTWVADLSTQATILAQVSLPAIEFNDPKVAQENLKQLQVRPTILAAAIYNADGKLFASYRHDNATALRLPSTPNGAPAGVTIVDKEIRLFQTISRGNEKIGTVYLAADYPMAERIQNYATILGIVLLASLVVATVVSTWLQAGVTKPILALTETMHQVIRQRDFSLRVNKTTEDEIGMLVDAFNSLLSEVGDHALALEDTNRALQYQVTERIAAEDALRQLNNTLEERIQTRTLELERAHEQLRQSQKMEAIGQLTGGVAHDFNNVLQVINGNIQLVQMGTNDPEAQKRLKTAAFASDRGAKLAAQLLAFARRQPLQPIPTNLGRVLRGMDDLLRRSLGETIQVDTIVAGSLWNTFVDPNQLENVILNLAINARDAMQRGGKLTLELGNAMLDDQYEIDELDIPSGQYVMLGISDTGSGMTREVIERAFEPFFTTKREGEGTGLGLSMAYGFVKQSKGHIKIYSEVGNGTTIKIYLPRSTEAEVQPVNITNQPVVGGNETILVVEDDAAVRATTLDILSGLGYRILHAHDGESALHLLHQLKQAGTHIDLLFTDVVMPGSVRSPQLAAEAKQIFPDISVLFTSGYTQNAIVHSGRLDPGVELISKPYRREDLARKVRHILNNRRFIFGASTVTTVTELPKPTPTDTSQPQATTGLRILVVEDNLDGQLMICELLSVLGHFPVGVSSGEDALIKLKNQEFDILFTDINLPGISGIKLARQVHQEKPALKVIFASGFGSVSEADIGFPSQSLPKPYSLEELQQVLS